MADSKLYDYEFYDPLIQEFLSKVKQLCKSNLISVVLFGSVARGKGKKESDIDFLIILQDASDDHYERLKPFVDIELGMRKNASYQRYLREGLMPCLSYLILSKREADENQYVFLDMVEDSIVLFDSSNYFKGRLSALKKRLSSLGSKKVLLEDGSWYWDLKPDLKLGEEFVL
nr:nucleotidyltransferase domain-containing protein [Candidatus Njordarchaeum guaymaensis]